MSDRTNYLGNILGQDPEALLALREVPAFRDCSGPLLEMLFRYGKLVMLREGEDLTREGEFDQWVYFIIKGRLVVFSGGTQVDTLISSLVGERCILGEVRRATLRAAAEGVTALGVDMSLLDALSKPDAQEHEPVALYLELLAIIAGEAVGRIAELEFNLLEFGYKYRTHLRAERIGVILQELAQGAYRSVRGDNFVVYRHLLKHHPVVLSRCTEADRVTVDTRQVYADALLAGDHALLCGLAEAVQAAREREAGPAPTVEAAHEVGSYAQFADHVLKLVLERHGSPQWDAATRQAMSAGIRERLRLADGYQANLRGLIEWLVAEYRITAEETVDLLRTLLSEASDTTGRINGQLKDMLNELTRTRFAKKLQSVVAGHGVAPDEYYNTTPLEAMIPFFSQNILEVYLVQPYLDRLHAADVGAWEQGAAPGESRDGLIDSLFE